MGNTKAKITKRPIIFDLSAGGLEIAVFAQCVRAFRLS